MNMHKDKSQKRKNNNINKTELWNVFDSEIENPNKQIVPLECIYGSGNREICERCETILAFSDEGFLTCTNNKCGIIYKDLVDHGAEWRYYGADDNQSSDPTRCGMPINPLLQESSYGCKVLCFGPMSYEMRKIRRYTEWQSMPYKEKSQYDEFQIITTMAQHAGIPKMIIDDAIAYHKKISEYELTFRGCKNALAIINNLEKDMDNKEKTNLGKTKPEAFIERYCSKLNINNELTRLCQFISMKIEKMDVMPENTPPSIAAGVVYFVSQICKLNISKRDVKNVSETSEVTINKCFKKLEKIQEELLPAVILKKYSLL
jgi:transcription initiation factor TFIIIB Brf1 subunit/transcription initiation factor TFIIB